MKTFAQWKNSGLFLNVFLQIGDAVDDEMVDYFIEVLPPACMSCRCIQIGEPFDHTIEGKPTFSTLEKQNGQWVYMGHKVTPKTEQCLYYC